MLNISQNRLEDVRGLSSLDNLIAVNFGAFPFPPLIGLSTVDPLPPHTIHHFLICGRGTTRGAFVQCVRVCVVPRRIQSL
jgi:hypothetical protein